MKYQALRPHFSSMVGSCRVLGVGGWWWGGLWGLWVVMGWVMGWVGGWWMARSWDGFGGGISGVGVGGWGGGVVGPHDNPHHGGVRCLPCCFFDNLVKKLDQIVKK